MFTKEANLTCTDFIPEKSKQTYPGVVLRQQFNGPAPQQVYGAEEADVLGFPVLLNVHEDVNEVLATHCQQLHVCLTRHRGAAPRPVH